MRPRGLGVICGGAAMLLSAGWSPAQELRVCEWRDGCARIEFMVDKAAPDWESWEFHAEWNPKDIEVVSAQVYRPFVDRGGVLQMDHVVGRRFGYANDEDVGRMTFWSDRFMEGARYVFEIHAGPMSAGFWQRPQLSALNERDPQRDRAAAVDFDWASSASAETVYEVPIPFWVDEFRIDWTLDGPAPYVTIWCGDFNTGMDLIFERTSPARGAAYMYMRNSRRDGTERKCHTLQVGMHDSEVLIRGIQ